jgi:hypothetical protein
VDLPRPASLPTTLKHFVLASGRLAAFARAMLIARTVDCSRSRDHPWWGASSVAPSHPMNSLVPLLRSTMILHASSRLDTSLQTVSGPPLAGGRSIAMLRPPRKHVVPAVRERQHPACGSGAWTGDCTRSRAPPRLWPGWRVGPDRVRLPDTGMERDRSGNHARPSNS